MLSEKRTQLFRRMTRQRKSGESQGEGLRRDWIEKRQHAEEPFARSFVRNAYRTSSKVVSL